VRLERTVCEPEILARRLSSAQRAASCISPPSGGSTAGGGEGEPPPSAAPTPPLVDLRSHPLRPALRAGHLPQRRFAPGGGDARFARWGRKPVVVRRRPSPCW